MPVCTGICAYDGDENSSVMTVIASFANALCMISPSAKWLLKGSNSCG